MRATIRYGTTTIGLGMALALLSTPASAHAVGETYTVVQCTAQNPGIPGAERRDPRPYGVIVGCGDPNHDRAVRIRSRANAKKGQAGRVLWLAPAQTGFVAVTLDAKLRRAAGHRARVYTAGASGAVGSVIHAGTSEPTGFRTKSWSGSAMPRIEASLQCNRSDGCQQSDGAKTEFRQIRLTLRDFADPDLMSDGSLIAGGWKRGAHRVIGNLTADQGSGPASLRVDVNGSLLQAEQNQCSGVIPGTGLATRLVPCSGSLRTDLGPSTAQLPFHDGANTVSVCARDFAGNQTCHNRQVNVDNTAPNAGFTNAQNENDPELITALVSDAHSGVASGQIFYRAVGAAIWTPLETVRVGGELGARVDSAAVPPGPYEFKTTVGDVAGNAIETTKRLDGQQKQLTFPLKAAVNLRSWLTPGPTKRLRIAYRKRPGVGGVLRDKNGQPLAGQELVVIQRFRPGALLPEARRRVTTGDDGRWSAPLPRGPSRAVTVNYDGTPRYLPDAKEAGVVRVGARVRMRVHSRRVREGKRVVIRGRIPHKAAEIPKRDSVRLETRPAGVREWVDFSRIRKRIRPSGRYRIAFRFGHVDRDIRWPFRVKVKAHHGWAYAAGRSKVRRVWQLNR